MVLVPKRAIPMLYNVTGSGKETRDTISAWALLLQECFRSIHPYITYIRREDHCTHHLYVKKVVVLEIRRRSSMHWVVA